MQHPSIHIPMGATVGYGRVAVARASDTIDLGPGNHFLLARNGRGKTTLLRTLARALRPVAGALSVAGRVQYLGDDLAFDQWLPARAIFKAMLPSAAVKPALELADKAELATGKPFGQLSKGNRQKVLLIMAEFRAREGEASVLLLDEPFTGLDSQARECFADLWASRLSGILRFITIHPDYDSMDMGHPVVISKGEIRAARPEEGRVWGEIKGHLN